jgi:serine/threonine-protein kinase
MLGMFASATAARLEPHNRVAGKFRLGRRLATGGMGEVWVARNESTGADVALKMLRRGDADRERELQIEERFRHEARLSAMLSHRSIVKVFDLLTEPDGTLVLVMELLRGETLQAYLERKGPRPAREGVAVVTPILSALAHAHERGIVHRDVTPSNIFLAVDPDGHVTPKLVDFGIAKLVGTGPQTAQVQPVQTVDGRVLGTPRYMAPERIRGSNELDGRADLFAVAVVLYETLTGVSPFAASSASASLAAVLERHVDPDERIEPRIWIEIQRAMAKRAYERHATAHELATALRAAVGETEGALEGSLRRTQPPGWDEESAMYAPPPRDRSIEGQSVAIVARKRVPTAMWLGAVAAAGVVLGGAAVGIRAAGRGDAPPRAPSNASASLAAPAAASHHEPSGAAEPSAPPSAAAETAATGSAVPPVASAGPAPSPADAPRAAPAVTSLTIPGATSKAPAPTHAAPASARPAKPIATTPGF